MLYYLNCDNNLLTSLDVTNNTALTQLFCYKNQLSSLDVTKNTALTRLWCFSNQLSSLDVSSNTALTVLYCYNNQLIGLDVSYNTALTSLGCGNNLLTNLDVSKNTALTGLGCASNPNLFCIQALNLQDKTGWIKDNTAEYNENCNYVLGINDEIISQPKTISTIYNLQGQSVNNSYNGLVIIRYTDGTNEKVIQ